jgi:dimethylargininase
MTSHTGATPQFRHAIVKTPGRSLLQGITTWTGAAPDYAKALEQHRAYIQALTDCGLQVIVLAPDEAFPDSTFVEDTAVIAAAGAMITRPGAESRRGETAAIRQALQVFFGDSAEIAAPGTLDGGDVMRLGNHFYIGLSARTNEAGAGQLIAWLRSRGCDGSTIAVGAMLHLKTGMSYLEDDTILLADDFVTQPAFAALQRIAVPAAEAYAANSLRINHCVLTPAGFPQTAEQLRQRGFPVRLLDVSEFRKLDGGLSCLSLRF